MGASSEADDATSSQLPDTVGLGPRGAGDPGEVRQHGGTPVPARGDRVGRFVVLRTLGIGGMGVVVSAYDPKLDRTVALKLMRPDVAPSESPSVARSRLLREAQAMAKLRHPNVVTVFEVGEFGGQVFLAMEYVPGSTLMQWSARQRKEPGGWQRIVAAFAEAGRGLVAAHARGLVHRDFKPSNVLVDGDRVQVTDFGIARIEGDVAVAAEPVGDAAQREPSMDTISGPGEVVGTAPYMAPELHEGAPADPKSDQFAFCVALYECLYGQRPFAADEQGQWAASIAGGRVLPPRDDHGVPQWLRRVLERGLSKEPQQRFSSMSELVEAIDSPEDSATARKVRLGIGVAMGAMFVGLPLLAKELGPPLDRSTYAGAVGQTLLLIASLLAMAWLARDIIRATAMNRKAFYAVLSVLGMQLPLELTGAGLGMPVVAVDILHLVLWAAMAAMFAVTLDRRFLILSATYLLFLPAAVAWTQHHLLILGLSNATLVAFVLVVWRPTASPSSS